MKGNIRKANKEDVDFLVENAREADKTEAFLMSGKSLKELFEEIPNVYEESFVGEVDGEVVCLYGITKIDTKIGVIWFIATDKFDKYKGLIARKCKQAYEQLIKGYNYLFNYVHCEHEKAIRWLEWLGFDIYSPVPIGFKGDYFCKFEVKNV